MNYYYSKFQELLQENKLDALVLYANTYNERFMKAIAQTHPILQNYILIRKGSVSITETNYLQLDLETRTNIPILITNGEDFGNVAIAKALGKGKRIGIVGDVKYADVSLFQPKKVVDLTKEANAIIRYKSDNDILGIAKYAELTSRIMSQVKFKPSVNTLDTAQRILKQILDSGCLPSFPTCITTGKDLHTTTTVVARDKKIKSKDIACIDMGLKTGMYTTDMTRMFFINHPTAKKLYMEIVKKNNEIIKTFVNHDRTFREIINKYENVFQNSQAKVQEYDFGHGIGFALHEKPIVEVDDKEKVGKNIIFTLEPTFETLYGKMRVEDMVAISSDGKVRNLTSYK